MVSSINSPSEMMILRCVREVMDGSCVTKTMVLPCETKVSNNWMIVSAERVSRLPVGSSATSKGGSQAMARAIPPNCYLPLQDFPTMETNSPRLIFKSRPLRTVNSPAGLEKVLTTPCNWIMASDSGGIFRAKSIVRLAPSVVEGLERGGFISCASAWFYQLFLIQQSHLHVPIHHL